MMIDISNLEVMQAYLSDRKIFESAGSGREIIIKYFSGGVSGTVAMASCGETSVVVKQALPFLKVSEVWESDPKRMLIEYRALESYVKLVPRSVPKPYYFDSENYIMIREAAPESCEMWKTHLMEGALDFRVAGAAIESLLTVHNETAGDTVISETFADDDVFYSLRISPYIEKAAQMHPRLAAGAKETADMLMSGKIALVHGDYSPKNILVDGTKIFILDMEVAHYGHPAFDVAFFANHFLLKAVKNKQWSDAYLNMLRYMLDIYFGGVTFADKAELERQTVQTLAYLFIARVDGKSPVEYIQLEDDKRLIRETAFTMLDLGLTGFGGVIDLLKKNIKK